MAARPDLAHCVERELAVIDHERSQELRHHGEKIGVEHHLLEGGLQASLHPARAMHEEIGAAHDRAPEREDALIGGLGVERVGGAGIR